MQLFHFSSPRKTAFPPTTRRTARPVISTLEKRVMLVNYKLHKTSNVNEQHWRTLDIMLPDTASRLDGSMIEEVLQVCNFYITNLATSQWTRQYLAALLLMRLNERHSRRLTTFCCNTGRSTNQRRNYASIFSEIASITTLRSIVA